MRVSCLQENLKRGLAVVGRAVASRSTLPITGNILLATDEGRLRLAATNLEIGITCWIGAKVEGEGAIAVPAKLLSEFVGVLPNDRIDLSLTGKVLRLKCARFEARINGQDADDFPLVATWQTVVDGASRDGEVVTVMVEAEALQEAISQVVFAAATDDSRPVLAGVLTQISEEEITFAAADGFRLSVRRLPFLERAGEGTVEVIIPARALAELGRVLSDHDDPVQVAVPRGKGQVLFHLTSIDLVSQLIQGNFPNYAQLVPQDYASRVVVNTEEFLAATRPAAIFARDSNGIVRLEMFPGEDLAPGKMIIRARAEELGDNQGEIDAIVEGEEARIAFNAKYLTDVLSVIATPQVALETKSPSSPGVVRPVGEDRYTHVIMPMFVQW
jgi:DNA polymerase-3 subunit beta